MLHRRDGARFLPAVTDGILAKEFNLRFIRPGILFLMVRVLMVPEEWFPSGHSTIKAWLVECCREGCHSGRFCHLHRGTLEHCQSDQRVLGHLADQGTSPLIAQFGWAASSRKSLGASKLLPFKNDEVRCICGDVQCCRNVLLPFPRSVPWHNPLLWYALLTVVLYLYRWVCAFQIMSNQLNLPQVDSNQIVETSQRMINGNRMHLSSILSLIANSLNTNVSKVLFKNIVIRGYYL